MAIPEVNKTNTHYINMLTGSKEQCGSTSLASKLKQALKDKRTEDEAGVESWSDEIDVDKLKAGMEHHTSKLNEPHHMLS